MNFKEALMEAFPVEGWDALEHSVDPYILDRLQNRIFDTKVSVVISARNEEKHLPLTLKSVYAQSVKPLEVIVVDDGSTDGTFNAAKSFNCKIIRLPFHSESYVGRPELAMRFNVGLSVVSMLADYVLILGADSELPKDYVEKLLRKLQADKSLKVASGHIIGEPFDATQPRGSGRLVDAKWWRKINDLQFPVVWGWEAWLQYKALASGYNSKSFKDIQFQVQRRSGLSLKQAECHGYSMNALGYFWVYALARCFSRGPKYGKSMLQGWVRGRGLKRLDIADYVCSSQKKRLASKMFSFISELR